MLHYVHQQINNCVRLLFCCETLSAAATDTVGVSLKVNQRCTVAGRRAKAIQWKLLKRFVEGDNSLRVPSYDLQVKAKSAQTNLTPY